ncbi:hypothetical protein NIES39_J01480 [Arthrospira platensis NIES-39]|nr:hypothetical protein NIES39_J01480 [Arthrospira platensis NIES-39]
MGRLQVALFSFTEFLTRQYLTIAALNYVPLLKVHITPRVAFLSVQSLGELAPEF